MRNGVWLSLLLFCVSHALTVEKLYFTFNTKEDGKSICPGFSFKYIWNAIGQAKSGKIFVAISDKHAPDSTAEYGDVCVAEYDPLSGVMRKVGTVVEALQASGNVAKTCSKVHTWITGTTDGKVWLGTEMAGYGGHLLYIDPATGKLVDYSRTQKYVLSPDLQSAVRNHPELPAGPQNGLSLPQGFCFRTMGYNPKAPRYLWTEMFPMAEKEHVFFMVCWDIINDTVYAYPGGGKDVRILPVGPDGAVTYKEGISDVRLIPKGERGMVKGSDVNNPPPSSFIYSRSFDTAFSCQRGTGIVEMTTFSNHKITVLADMPDHTDNINETYRAIALSGDDASLYLLGDGGNIYELDVQTGRYAVLENIRSYLAGSYAISNGLMDRSGNWYIVCFGNDSAYILKIHLGDYVSQITMPG